MVATTSGDRTVMIIRDYRVGPIGVDQFERWVIERSYL